MGIYSGPGLVRMDAFTNNPPTGGIQEISQRYNITGFFAISGASFGYSLAFNEANRLAYVTFYRMYGTLADLVILYNTSNGTGVAGVDYTATSGFLHWAQGEKGSKTVTIPLLATSKITPDTFFLNFAGYLGTDGTHHGLFQTIYFFYGGDFSGFPHGNFTIFPPPLQITIVRSGRGTLQFAGTPYSVQRPGGTTTVTLQVNRVYGYKGAVGCSYHTTDGTAVAGVAYTAKTGTLSWADGDTQPKSIVITILSGGTGTQSFTVTIDTPTGGVSISGTLNVATVNIVAAAPPANPPSVGGIPNQIVDQQAWYDVNCEVQSNPNIPIMDNLSLSNRNILYNSGYATAGSRPDLNDVFFISTTVGWAVGDGGVIVKTTDGGATWVVQTSGVNVELNGIFFSDSTHGWAVGATGTILVTSDGGTTWTPQSSGVVSVLNSVYFTSNTNGWAVGDGGVILVTTNGGGAWTPQSSGVATDLNDVYFVDATHGWAVGDGGVILFYNGSTWAPQSSGVVTNLNGVTFINSTHGWAVGDDGVILFFNGSTWTPQSSGTNADLFEVDFASSTVGWAVGESGTILVTGNGGSSWTAQDSGTTYDLYGISAPSTSIAFIVGEGGVALHTTSGGADWDPMQVPLPIGGGSGNGGSFGGGDDYGNYDQTFQQSQPIRFTGVTY